MFWNRVVIVFGVIAASTLAAAETAAPRHAEWESLVQDLPAPGFVEIKDAPAWFQEMVQRILRDNVPDKYVEDKDWGRKDRRWDGLKIRRDGLRISTKRRWKEVNHGTWRRYEIRQIAPEENLTLRIENVHQSGEGQVGFDIRLSSSLHTFARQAKWAKGVKLYSISLEAEADVQLHMQCEVGIGFDVTKLPPDIVLQPNVTGANLDVSRFQVHRISKLDGPLAEQLGHGLRRILNDKIQEKRHKLPDKVNRQISKNADKLRFSPHDLAVRKWKTLIRAGEQPASGEDPGSTPEELPATSSGSSDKSSNVSNSDVRK